MYRPMQQAMFIQSLLFQRKRAGCCVVMQSCLMYVAPHRHHEVGHSFRQDLARGRFGE